MKSFLIVLLLLVGACKDSKVSKTGDIPDTQVQPVCPSDPDDNVPDDPPVCREYILNNEISSTQTRLVGTEVLSIFNEILNAQNSTMPSNYLDAKDPFKDVDSGVAILQARPSIDCGNGAEFSNIEDRINNCSELNGELALWNGAENGTGAEVTWKLVAKLENSEVWRDEMTKLVWSADLGSDNWCRASGDSKYFLVSNNNGNITVDCRAIGNNIDICGNLNESNKAIGNISNVSWRLPTRSDYLRADVNGIRFALPQEVGNKYYWTSTSHSSDITYGWTYGFRYGDLAKKLRSRNKINIRCVGRGN